MRRALLLPFLLLVLVAVPWPVGDAAAGDEVIRVRVTGTITQGTTLHIEAALDEAEERDVPLVLHLDTPGGLVDATLDIDRALADAEVPVLSFVGPRGGFAASAGAFLLLMGHPNGMADGTTVGSAQPVNVGAGGGSEPAGDKVTNFLVGRIEAIAERTGHNATQAARFITHNDNLNASTALERNVIDVVAPDLRAFLDAVDGRTALVGDETVVLTTQDARIVDFERPLLSRIVDVLGNPQIAFVLVLAGTYAVIFGLANPGSYVPEVLGALVLLLGFIGLGLFDTSTAGVLLLLLGVLFLVVEVFTPTHGVLAGAGVVALLFAAVFLLRDEPLLAPGFLRTFLYVGVALALVSGGVTAGAIALAVRTQDRPVHDRLRGAQGTALEPVGADGRVTVHGEVWNARTDGPSIPQGDPVLVVDHEGLTLLVEAAEPPRGDGPDAEDEAE